MHGVAMARARVGSRVRGFTLIEILVVLVIMGILVGMVSVNAYPDDRKVLRMEADRLAQILQLAAEESRITGKSIAWTADRSGYRFWRIGADDEWSEIFDNNLLRARSLAHDVTISNLRIEAGGPQKVMRLEFPPGGAMLAFSVDLSLGAERIAVGASPVGDVGVLQALGETDGDLAGQ